MAKVSYTQAARTGSSHMMMIESALNAGFLKDNFHESLDAQSY